MKSTLYTLSLVALLPQFQAHAESTRLTAIPFVKESIVLDGKLNEAVWQKATRVVIDNEFNPGNNVKAKSKAVAYLYENGSSLFIGIEAEDAEPSQIKAQYTQRDNIGADDRIGVLIDTFNDQRGAFEFFLNPLGVQQDKYRDENRNSSDSSWDAIWYGAGAIHNTGYTLEYEIPFSALRFPQSNTPQTWGIGFIRVQPRSSNIKINSATRLRENDCLLCQVPKYLGFSDIEAAEDFQIIPSLYATRTDVREDNDVEPANLHPWEQGKIEPEMGLDLRWGINQGNVLNLTLNPDFSQVASDESSVTVNNSFAPSFPEKRDFFLEGKEYFQTSRLNLVHTRNITSPDYGLKFTGKAGTQSYGVLYAKDEETHFRLPSAQGSKNIILEDSYGHPVESQALVARYRKEIGSQSNLGLLVTHRSSEHYQNTVASLDGIFQINTANKFIYHLAYSDTQNPESIRNEPVLDGNDLPLNCSLFEGSEECIQDSRILTAEESDIAYDLKYQFSKSDFILEAIYQNFGKDFRADLGNMGQVGFDKLLLASNRWWYGKTGSSWTKWGVKSDWDQTYRHDGVKIEEELEGYIYIDGPSRLHASLGVIVRETYHGGQMYEEAFVSLYSRIDPTQTLHLWADLSVGEAVVKKNNTIGDLTSLKVGTNWRLGTHLSGTLKYKFEKMDVENGRLYDINQIDFNVNLQLDLANSFRVTFSHSDVSKNDALYLYDDIEEIDKQFSTQMIYTYEPNPKTICYIGYVDGGKQDEHLDELERNTRSLFMKLSYAFQI